MKRTKHGQPLYLGIVIFIFTVILAISCITCSPNCVFGYQFGFSVHLNFNFLLKEDILAGFEAFDWSHEFAVKIIFNCVI